MSVQAMKNRFHSSRADSFSAHPQHVFATVSHMVDNAKLGDRLVEYAPYGLRKTGQVVRAGNKDVLHPPL